MYQLTPLGSLPSLQNSLAYGINEDGQVTGMAFGRNTASAVPLLYTGTKMSGLGISQGAGKSINSEGKVAGEANGQAFLYNGSTVTYLGEVSGGVPTPALLE
jgi:uncharacterized membrane protein